MTATNKIEEFLKYLSLRGVSQKSLKYYKSDIVNFLHFSKDRKIDRSLVTEYIETEKLTTPLSTLNRRLSTLRSYSSFMGHNFMEGVENVSSYKKIIKSWQDRILSKFETKPKIKNALFKLFFTRPNWYKKYHSYPLATYIHIAILILFTSVSGYAFYDQVFYSADRSLAFPSALTRPNRFLSFQGRLTSNVGNPITSATNVVFRLYDASSGGTTLWNSGTCSITPDQDGIFSTLLGSSCGAEIASSVFSENAAVWVGVTVAADAEATPRIQIATVAYALNSETLQGFPAGTGTSTIPYINSSGILVLANASPKLQSTSGTFSVEGQALTITTPNTSNGVITVNPDGVGTLDLTFEGAAPGLSANGFVNATNANITSGSLYSGTVASNASGYNFINFLSGSSPTSKFSVDSTGLTTVGADLYVSSGISLFNNAVSDDTVEATKFCTGDGETNCVTDFSTIGVNYWARSAGNLSPLTLNDTISATTSASIALTLTQTGAFNALLVEDQASDTTPFVIDQSGNVGIGKTTANAVLDVAGTASISGTLTLGNGTTNTLRTPFGGLNFDYKSGANTWATSMTVDDITGYVGIGTTAPANRLHAYTTSADQTVGKFEIADSTAITASTNVTDVAFNALINASGAITGVSSSNVLRTITGTKVNAIDSGVISSSADTLLARKVVYGIDIQSSDTATHGTNLGLVTSSTIYGVNATVTGKSANILGTTYGYYSTTSGGDTNYDFYGSSASSWNYFAGSTGIGDNTPDAPLDVVGDVYISDGLSLFETAVSDGTVEATKFCTGDGETNCVTDFSTIGVNYWARSAGNLSPLTLNDTISATTSASVALTLTQTGAFNALLVEDQASDTTPFVIDQSGNVGIGTTTTTEALNVGGNIRLASNGWVTSTAGYVAVSPATILYLRAGSGSNINIGDQFANNILMANGGGKIGIGTTTPTALLDVAGDASASGHLVLRGSGTNYIHALNGSAFGISTSVGGDAGNTERLTVLNSGNVGIGTTAPARNLVVYSSADIPHFQLASATSGVTNTDGFQIRTISNETYLTNFETSKMYLGNGGTQDLTIDASGNVGIGDTSPGAPLDVVGDVYISDGLSLYETAVSNGTVEATQFCTGDGETNCITDFSSIVTGSSYWTRSAGNISPLTLNDTISATTSASVALTLTQTGAFNALLVEDQASDTTPFVIDQSGNVGIGTSTPSQIVHAFQQSDVTGLDILGEMYSAAAGNRTNFKGDRSRGTVGAAAIVQDGDALVGLTGRGYDGSAYQIGARLAITVDGTPGAGDMPGRFQFYTTPDGSSTPLERMRINNAGNVGVGDTSPLSLFTVGPGDLFQINSSGIISTIDGVAHTIDDISGNLTFTSNSTAVSIADDLYLSSGLSTFSTAVSDGTVEATKFCTGDGETNCITDFSSIVTGSSYWTKVAGNISPLTLNDTISATTSASVALTLTQTGAFNVILVEDQASDTTPFVIDQSGNVGIGVSTPSQQLEITGDFEMPVTTFADQSGIIYKGVNRFMHDFNYGNNGTVTTDGKNTFSGVLSGNFTTGSTATSVFHGSYNTGYGYSTLTGLTTGYNNVAVGYNALTGDTTGNTNTAIGASSLNFNSTGNTNTALGYHSLRQNQTGSNNVGIGSQAGTFITGGVTGNLTSDFSVYIGDSTKALADNDQNEIVIGYNATGIGSNTVTLGADTIITTALKGNVGIGVTAPTAKLSVVDSTVLGGTASIYGSSLIQTLTGTPSTTITSYGNYSSISTNVSDGTQNLTTYAGYAINQLGTGNTIDTLYGQRGSSIINSSTLSTAGTTATTSAGLIGLSYLSAAGTVTNQYGTNSLTYLNADGGTITSAYGIQAQSYENLNPTTGGITNSYGGSFIGQDGTVSYGVYAQGIQNTGNTETFAQLYGTYSDCSTNSSTVTVTSCFGVRGNITETLGTITNGYAGYFNTSSALGSAYGVYANVTGASTTNYGIYSNVSGATTNYAGIFMGGNVGIGDATPTAPLDVVGDVYISSGLSTFGTAVSDGTVEATKFCTGDGETNCVTDFSTFATGTNYWTKVAGNISPLTLNDTLSATTSASVALTLTQTGAFNALLVEDQASDTTPFVIDQSGNIGVGTSAPNAPVQIYSDLGTGTGSLYLGTGANSSTMISAQGRAYFGYGAGGVAIVQGALTKGIQFNVNNNTFGSGTAASITSAGLFGIGTTGPDAKLDSLSTTEQLRLTYTDGTVYSSHTVDSSGDLTIDNTGTKTVIADNLGISGILQVGGITPTTYSRFGTATTQHAGNLTASNDVLMQDLEVDGTLFLDGGIIANISGTTAVSLSATPETTSNNLSAGNWMVDNTANVGQAALIVNNTKAGDLFTASASGATKFVITNAGNVGVGTNLPTGKFDITDTSNTAASFVLTNNTATTIGAGANTLGVIDLQSTSLTTGNFMNIELNALTSGKGFNLTSTSTALTTGNLMALDWSPASATTATGDLFTLNIGANGNVGNLFNIKDSGTSIFSVSESAVTANIPASFTSVGDVSIAYDLVFTNSTASYVKSAAPLYIQAGETFNSSNLTLLTYNSGNILLDPALGGVGIGTGISPVGLFDVNGKKTGKALAIFNETGNQDIFTASASGTTRISITSAGNILPGTDNTQSLGSSPSARFKDLYLGPASLHIQSKSTDAGYPTLGLDYSIGINTAGSLVTSLNNTSVMTITQGGNVILGSNAKLADSYVTAGISLGDATSTALSGFGATSLIGALNELKTTNKNISHNDYLSWANHYNAKAEGSSVNTNETLNGLFFDTFDDSTKFDGTNSTSSGVIKISDNNSRVGITGGQTYNTATNDNDGQAYLGSNTVNDIYYYDRTRDSSPEVQVELGIDPNWYNGVTLSIATSSASYSQNGTLADKNPNLTTSYNGSLIKVTGTDATPRTIYITIKSPTTFDWTNYQGDAATGVTITPGTAQALGATGVSATFTATNYNVGDVFKIASWFIEAEGTTRGAKQQFPERASIVGSGATTAVYVDIIDADTQKLWMRFSANGNGYGGPSNLLLGTSAGGISAITMLNGQLYIAKNGGSAEDSFDTARFTTDSADSYFSGATYQYKGSLSQRNTQLTPAYSVKNNIGLVGYTSNDVAVAVIPNQTTKEVTVSGWGYILGNSTATLAETVNLPYKFNTTPVTTVSMNSYSTNAPTSIESCVNKTSTTVLSGANVRSSTPSSFIIDMNVSDGAAFSAVYFCYTWTATGIVSPKQFVAVATGASSADGGISIINETDGSVANVSIGSAYPNPTWFTKTAIAGNSLYTAGNYSTENVTFLPVYYGIHGLQTESSFALYRNGFYHVQNNSSGWSATGPIILGTAAGFNQITSLIATENTSTNDPTANTIYVGTTTGLSVIQEKQGHGNIADGLVESGGSVKYYTKDYISEEMVGDIRGMWPLSANGALSMSDASIKADTLTNNGTATTITGVRGGGVSLNGTTQYLTCTDAACGGTAKLDSGGTVWSFGAWYKTSAAGTHQRIIDKWGAGTAGVGAYLLNINTVNQLTAGIMNSAGTQVTTSESITTNDGLWHQGVVTYDGVTLKLYKDGQLVSQIATAITIADGSTNFGIGAAADGTSKLTGSIDEPFVTANTLTAGQIKNMYQVGYRALQSHASSGLGTAAADTNQQLGFISTGTSSIGSVAPDFNNQYMYVGTNSTTLGAVSKIQLNSDTNIKTYNSSANVPAGGTLLIDEDATNLGVGYQLEAVGSAASGVKSMAPDNNANALTGSLFSKTQTLSSSTKFAYLWTSFVTDASDATSAINIYACNAYATKALCDSNSAWVLGTIVQTDSNQSPPEREYNFAFPTAGSSLTFKVNFSRGSTKTNTYIERYGATWSSSVGGADLAERYKSSEAVFPGDIVTLTEAPVLGEATVALSRQENDRKVIGIVTTNPGIVMDDSLVDLNFNAATRNSPDRPAVALSGRVPLKVSTKNGSILVGDAITTSDIPGVGVKAIKAGNIVAKAIESFKCEEGVEVCEGKIMAFVNVSWFDPDVYLTDAGDIRIKGFTVASADGTKTNTIYKIVRIAVNGVEEVIDRIGVFGALTTGRVETGTISPIANSDLIIDLDPASATESSRLVIKGENDAEVASIDAAGNASFSGTVISDELAVTNDATISGTLYADVIESERLDEIEALLAEVEGNQALFAEAINWSTDTATSSATISDVIASNLFVTGNATVTSLFVAENLTAKSLDSIDGTLSIQSLAIAPIEIMAGKIKIDTNGDAIFTGNVAIAGNLELTGNFVVAEGIDPLSTASATIVEGQINSNSTAGKALLPANTTELKIINPKIKTDSLIYVTPVSSTENKVLYVKSKNVGEFTIGFNESITTDVEFNWWIIELKQ